MRPEYRGARIVRGGRLLPIPDDFRLFAPTTIAGMVRSGLFGPVGVVRAALEPFIPARRGGGDESVASFVTRRFGREVLDRLAQPLIGGIYSGDPRRLSMQATLPMMLMLERKYGSMVRGIRAAARAQPQAQPLQRLVSLRGGLGSMIAALERELGASIRTSSAVESLRYRADDGRSPSWRIALAGGEVVEADAVVCALPAPAAASLIGASDENLARLLRSIAYHSVVTVTLAYETRRLPELPRCTGFVVPFSEGRSIMSTTISTQKFAGRAPDGVTLLRAYAGGALQPHLAQMDDAALFAVVRGELRALLGIAADPAWTVIRRWQNALPEYAVGHADLVDTIEREAARLPGFALAGSAYRGVGIADCVRSGEEAAAHVV
jgi:oxygen-dependent protoporphyrinogen oxidase